MFNPNTQSIKAPLLVVALCATSLGLASNPLATAAEPNAAFRRPTEALPAPRETGSTADARASSSPSEEPAAQQSLLARRFVEALTAPATHQTAPKRNRAIKSVRTTGAWTCGQWQELWQGRGQGRTCEFK